MKNQEKSKQQTPQNETEAPKTSSKKPAPEQRNENQQSTPQNAPDKNKKEQKLNPGIGKEHQIGDLPEKDAKNKGGDGTKIKDPDPTIPERRNDPVAGKGDDYSRTRNTPGKDETRSVGEFTEIDEMDREESETSEGSDEEEEEPGSFDPENEHKEAFGGERKNTISPDERKNKNGL